MDPNISEVKRSRRLQKRKEVVKHGKYCYVVTKPVYTRRENGLQFQRIGNMRSHHTTDQNVTYQKTGGWMEALKKERKDRKIKRDRGSVSGWERRRSSMSLWTRGSVIHHITLRGNSTTQWVKESQVLSFDQSDCKQGMRLIVFGCLHVSWNPG